MSDEKAKVHTVEKEIVRSGYAIDGRYMSRSVVKAIYNNTKSEILNKGLLIPLKFGHEDPDQRLKGRIIDVTLKKKMKASLRTFEYCIFAKIEMFEDAYKLYRTGVLPNLSVEAPPFGMDEDGNEFGEYISALALLGIDPPALPWLMHKFKDKQFCYSLLPKFEKEQKAMDPKEILAKLEEISMLIADVRGMIAPEDGGEEDAEAEPDKEEKEANPEDDETVSFQNALEDDKDPELSESENRIKALEQQVKALETEKSFNELHKAGKIASDQKDQFANLVKETSTKFAIDHYSQNKTKAPPADRQTKSNTNSKAVKTAEMNNFWNEHFKTKYKMTGDKLDQYTKMAVQKQLAKESTNGSN
jgi:hypothetical protein